MAQRHDQAGFTLLEILVVTMLSAVVLMVVTGGLQYAGHVRSMLNTAAARHDEVFAARRMIIRMVDGALPVFRSTVYSDRTLTFEGLPDAVTLVGWLPDAIGPGLAGVERLYVSEDGSGTSLFFAWRLDLPSSSNDVPLPEQRLRLLSGVRRFSVLYFGRDPGTPAASWHTSWSDRTHLPDEVRVELTSDGGRAASLAPFYAAPVATAVPSCRFDPENIECMRVQ